MNESSDEDKRAFVVVIAPEQLHDDEMAKKLTKLKNDFGDFMKKENKNNYCEITESKMIEAKKKLNTIIQTTHTENLIVVVIADGFYSDDGEAIIFDDCYTLLDSFIHKIIYLKKDDRQCKIKPSFLNNTFLLRRKLHTDELSLKRISSI